MADVADDLEQLSQVLVNLVQNAIDAMPTGERLTVSTARHGGVATIEVADTGPGVRPEDAGRIFRPFHSTKPLGAGLGLAVARENMQGARWVPHLPPRRRRRLLRGEAAARDAGGGATTSPPLVIDTAEATI